MYQKVLNHFKAITSIPHCSFETSALCEHIIKHAKKCEYEVKTDKVNNILCKKGEPKVCLQSHYDMVCMGVAPNIETYEEDGWLKAKNSSLGADNGMGAAIALALMETHENLECLFTNDEEVGLIGANGLEIPITSTNLLNLDSEEEDEVIIGCAGGAVIFGSISGEKVPLKEDLKAYEISIQGMQGGHSGVDITKNIKSALKVLGYALADYDCKIASIQGGERNNSIPKYATATVFCKEEIVSESEFVVVKPVEVKEKTYYKYSDNILHVINSFAQGVRVYDEDLKMAQTSINLSIVKEIDGQMVLEFYARSMADESLENVKSETYSLLKGFGFDVKVTRDASSWQPVKTPFALLVKSVSEKYIDNVKICAIHAGLECGVIVQKQPSITGVCSIGPTIEFPHSTRERCLLSSVEKITKVVDEVIKKL